MKFNLPAYSTNFFSTTVWIKCPKCAEKALVTSQPTTAVIPLTNHAEVHCTSCSFKTTERNWRGYYQGFVNLPCGYCGARITHCTKPIKEIYAEAKSTGYDTKTMRKIVALRKMDTEKRRESEELLELYKSAIGLV